jgi:hypothetical protein
MLKEIIFKYVKSSNFIFRGYECNNNDQSKFKYESIMSMALQNESNNNLLVKINIC